MVEVKAIPPIWRATSNVARRTRIDTPSTTERHTSAGPWKAADRYNVAGFLFDRLALRGRAPNRGTYRS